MFSKRTVFILGAGASWHYGYPTGETLVKKIIEKAAQLEAYLGPCIREEIFSHINFLEVDMEKPGEAIRRWQNFLQDCVALREGLEQVNPLVIDYYLGWNPHLATVGRLLIAWVILDCERKAAGHTQNQNRHDPTRSTGQDLSVQANKDDWCRFIVHQLAMNCKNSADLLENKVSFQTFNYDVSVDSILQKNLSHIKMFNDADVTKFLSGSRVNHLYGSVPRMVGPRGTLNWKPVDSPARETRAAFAGFLEQIHQASTGLKVIDPHDKTTNEQSFQIARTVISNAECVYILGFGFDQNNSERLALEPALRRNDVQPKSVFFTNFENSNRINKRASKLFFGNTMHFGCRDTGTPENYAKSVRNVYGALELDFEAFD